MDRFQIDLIGDPPGMLQHRMTDEKLLGLRDPTQKPANTAAKLTLEEEAKTCIHVDGDGDPCIPEYVLMSCLIDAGVFIRLDKKRQLSTAKTSLLPGLLIIEDLSMKLLLPDSGKEISKWGLAPWRYTLMKGTNANTGDAICIVRPLFERWAIRMHCQLDTTALEESTFRTLFDHAGRRMGLGAYRPSCKGKFGMFKVQHWTKLSSETKAAKKAA